MEINTLINHNKFIFNKYYNDLLKKNLDGSYLAKAMKYGLMNGGKRIRPFLVSQSSKLTKTSFNNCMVISSTIESIHAYSLIHDDLPSMDNDDFRRGKPSTHKKFDEATAILAGDALHDFAFELLSSKLKKIKPETNIKLLNYLTKCTGYEGLAGGQSLDLLFENKKLNKNKIMKMYHMKTGKLFEFSFASTFILAEEPYKKIKFSKEYGSLFGIIFQIIDDLLDETNNINILGKTPGKDYKQGKSTIQNLIGKSEVINYCKKIVDEFIKRYENEFVKTPILEKLLKYNLYRLK